MRITEIDPATLSLADLDNDSQGLYIIVPNSEGSSYELKSMDNFSLSFMKMEHLIVRISSDDIFEEAPVVEEKPKRGYSTRGTFPLTYKFFGCDPTESIFVDFKPESGGIRISFNDKESAQAYFNYFREQFYTSTTGASVITVSNIYKDLNVVNWNPEDCDDWGWYTLDNGTCRYISDVRKNKNNKKFGFTLSKPTKLYESKKKA